MKFIFNCLLFLVIHITVSGQTVIQVDKHGVPKQNRLKDTVIYQIITQTRDTFEFGIDKKIKILDTQSFISNTLKINNKVVEINCFSNSTLLMSLNLESSKNWNDTIAVYSILDPTFITRFVIIKTFNCEIKNVYLHNYDKVKQYAYCRRFLNKLFDFKKD